jgi:DNA primase
MDLSVEALKQVNLVEFLSRHYGLEFRPAGGTFACLSPFTEESTASFFVRPLGEHWLFKDFSAGAGGSIFDFVRMKENLGSFSEALAFLRRLLGASFCGEGSGKASADPGCLGSADRGLRYDVEALYERFRSEDPAACRRYLLARGIARELVEELIGSGTVVHNRYRGRSYCCFAVRDGAGRLWCLDNQATEGAGKFVLGVKTPFTLEHEAIHRAKVVFLTEGIIDYLSVKTLERDAPPGLALLGNQLCFDRSLLEGAGVLVSAMDADRGGNSAFLDLQALYPDKEVRVYDLEGHGDPNELLVAARSGKGRRLSAERKLQLYREFQSSTNKAELAQRWGIDRSHLYEIVRDCDKALLEAISGRKPGRRPKGVPATLPEAIEQIKKLEAQYEQEATRREELYCRSEFLALRLKWAEIEAREARGETVDPAGGPEKKPQIKKKRRSRRST